MFTVCMIINFVGSIVPPVFIFPRAKLSYWCLVHHLKAWG